METGVVHEQPQRTERQGMPVWWNDVPGPFWAAMMFRVGQADEPLSMRGITHLVEHLALFPLGRREHEYNGFVDDVRCVFHATGEREEVLDFLRRTTASLADLPLDRLELERRVLRNESPGGDDVVARMRAHRFGAATYGLPNYLELGLRWVGAEQVGHWARTRFTRGNVVFWMSGEPPEDLGIELPDGERIPTPPLEEVVMQYPAFLAEGTGGVMVTATAKRSTALRALSVIAGERLYDAVRRDRGMAYAPYGGYTPLDADIALVTLASDCQDPDAPAVLEAAWDIVEALGVDGATQEELDRYRRTVERMIAEPEAARGELDARATNELIGHEQLSTRDWLAELEALTPGDLAAAARELVSTAIMLGPEGCSAPAGRGFCPFAIREPAPVEGRRHLKRGRPDGQAAEYVTIDDRGISYHMPGSSPATVEWARCSAAEHRPDGGSIVLYAREGTWIVVSSHDLTDGEALLAEVRRRVADVLIPSADAEVAVMVEREAAMRLAEPRLHGNELARLAGVLETAEEIRELQPAQREGTPGLLTLTDRRLLWFEPGEFLDIPLADVTEVKLPRLRLIDGPMEIVAKHGTLGFDVRPMKRARDLAARIEAHAG